MKNLEHTPRANLIKNLEHTPKAKLIKKLEHQEQSSYVYLVCIFNEIYIL